MQEQNQLEYDYVIKNNIFNITIIKCDIRTNLVISCTNGKIDTVDFSNAIKIKTNTCSNISIVNFQYTICLPSQIKNLITNYNYDKHIDLPKYINCVIFKYYYNSCVFLPKMLVHITFGTKFDKPIILNKNVIVCILQCDLNRCFIKLTKKLKQFSAGYMCPTPFVINKNLLRVIFGFNYNGQIILNKHLISLSIGTSLNCPLLTPFITQLTMYSSADQKLIFDKTKLLVSIWINPENHFVIDNLPNNSLVLEMSNLICTHMNTYKQLNNLPNDVTRCPLCE